MLYILQEEIRCIKEKVTFCLTFGVRYTGGTETGMVTEVKGGPHTDWTSVITLGLLIWCYLTSAWSLGKVGCGTITRGDSCE